MSNQTIRVIGARQHNLKNLNLEIPLNRITVVSGVSGSGKSSLAFDTLYAEGQRRYVETFSPYARQFMDRMDRPHVDAIEGIPPAIAIDRKDPVRTSRSTVGTMTEITDYVKLLYARQGVLHCRKCHKPVVSETPAHIWKLLAQMPEGAELVITFPYPVTTTGGEKWEKELLALGFDRLYIENRITPLTEIESKTIESTVDVIADRLILKGSERQRIFDSLELAFRFGDGRLDVWLPPDQHHPFSQKRQCAACGIEYPAPLPNLFSFNSPLGACDTCRGFGRTIGIDLDLIIPNPSLTLAQGAIKPFGGATEGRFEYKDLADFCRREKISLNVPFKRLKAAQREAIIKESNSYYGIEGFFRWLETKTYKMPVRVYLSRYRSYDVCPACAGTRFKPEALLYQIDGKTIAQVYALNVDQAAAFFKGLGASDPDEAGRMILSEIEHRLQYLQDVGLGYLTLDRQSRTLSGGEVQRVSLASALGSSLVNTLYVLDEPSIGLHPRDNHRLIRILKGLRDLSNTVVVVEHDPEIMRESDFLLDLGPRAGDQGGEVVYFGPTQSVNGSLTGQYLTGQRSIPLPARKRIPSKKGWLVVKKARENNLKGIDLRIPLGLFVCLTGVSGSGKSTLAEEILYKAAKRGMGDPQGKPGAHSGISGLAQIEDVILVDQRPIGRTPRANLLTYTKALDPIRHLLAGTETAKAKKFGPGHFSFNVPGGRCETCKGEGFEKVEMQFLSDVFITCPDCGGKRYQNDVLEVTYEGRNIYDILCMTVDETLDFFRDRPRIINPLKPLQRVGLGYIRLGQPISTLSGGEAQRLKLARYLAPLSGRLFIFDEPTTGLHFEDIVRLLDPLQELVNQGNTVLVIEHNMDVVKTADWVIDLGPEGGDQGGYIVAAGPPEEIARNRDSHTGRFLKAYITQKGRLKKNRTEKGRVVEATAPYQPSPKKFISLTGAREHNLKNISLEVPHNELVVMTGVSGSGKSTLAFDILFAEGQRRYLESLAPYVRQYMKILERPEVDLINGLAPTVAIEQRVSHASRRSTVATLTEIYHFLRLLYSKLGVPHCPGCGRRLSAQTPAAIISRIRARYARKKALLLAPKVYGRKGFHKEVFSDALKKGFHEARIDGTITRLEPGLALSRYHEHTIELVIGRLPAPDLEAMIGTALKEGSGSLVLADPAGADEIFNRQGICPACGIGLPELDPRLFSFNSKQGACPVCNGLGVMGEDEESASRKGRICPECKGSRLRPEALAVKIGPYSIGDLMRFPAPEALAAIQALPFTAHEKPVADPILAELRGRLALLERLGLSYLALGRSGDTLSGGEAQRVRLAAQLGSNLTGVSYILDEPTIGLHPRDNRLLIEALKTLRDRGNTILVVEHDEETICAADTIIDLGPGAGKGGGEVVAVGTLRDLKAARNSVTGALMDGGPRKLTSRLRFYHKSPVIKVRGAVRHNLKQIDAVFPLGCFICVTGISGSGKSTLLKETLYQGLRRSLKQKAIDPALCKGIDGVEQIKQVLEVDHSPIGRTPRSVPASYVGFLSAVRERFALTPAAQARGFRPGRFSFNVAEGRCPACQGQGQPKVQMSFLPDVYVPCEVCQGARFNKETLAVKYKGKSIGDVLSMTFAEAAIFFSAFPAVRRAVQFVCDIGLGYLTLGQPSPTLSGGEAQRIKLARQLAGPANGQIFYILDEPSTGLHMADVKRLVDVLQNLVDRGNTVAVIEHNMEIIKEADYIIDMGPEGGDGGGRIVAAGSPREILRSTRKSYTARFLKAYLEG